MTTSTLTREEMFSPLLRYLDRKVRKAVIRENALSNYMYMMHSDEGYAYKHHASRAYILISESGKLLDGKVDLREW